uniref:Uncharacterized protein n=1 Tax=Anguilla anguilla TaxID=7936 RepID=A0A0E9RQ51_ANGAN
MLNSHPNKLY